MATFLFNEIIFGPVRSRRLGVSLGVNLLPVDKKYCNFDCIYCECGWTCNKDISATDLPSRNRVRDSLLEKIQEILGGGSKPDVITFAGNGEPTIHPAFTGIIEDTIQIRDQLCPDAQIAVLSNAAAIFKLDIRNALKKVDQNILKLDSTREDTYRLINQPIGYQTVSQIIENLEKFNGKLVIQTLFFRGVFKGTTIDNTREPELIGLFEAYKRIRPEKVMVYTFDRDTPTPELEKVPLYELNAIAELIEKLGIPAEVTG